MSTEIFELKPLCWIRDKDDMIFYKECSYDSLKEARKRLSDIDCFDVKWKKYTITHYEIQKYGEADVIDHFLFFILPKEEKYIRDRFHTLITNMSKKQRSELNYEYVKKWIDKQKEDMAYYDTRSSSWIAKDRIEVMRREAKFKLYFSWFHRSILAILGSH